MFCCFCCFFTNCCKKLKDVDLDYNKPMSETTLYKNNKEEETDFSSDHDL